VFICVDVDCVLNNLQEAVVDLYNERYGTVYTLDWFKEYEIEKILPRREAVIMKQMYSEAGIYDHVKPLPGAQEGLRKLIDAGHNVLLVTASESSVFDEKVKWINHYFPFVDSKNIVLMYPKHLLKCDVLIEDNLQTLLDGHYYDRFCMDYPWNQTTKDWVYDIIRVHNWDEIINEINKRSDID
jgi:5'(3')-deoxyribonucleotidase